MKALSLAGLAICAGCLRPVPAPPAPVYPTPPHLRDGGARPRDGGVLDGGPSRSVGTVDGRTPNLSSAIAWVSLDDAGVGRTSLFLSDAPDLCRALASDAGLGPSWDVLRFRLAGDQVAAYPVAPVLPPAGAIAEFDYQTDAGTFGAIPAAGGTLQLDALDPTNVQSALGTYTLTFSGTDSLAGTFIAAPCALSPPAPGF